MKWIQWGCISGLLASLLAWGWPTGMKPYHVHHWMDDWKIALVQHTSEYGFARNGIVMGRFSTMYYVHNPKLIAQLRADWRDSIVQSNKPWPIASETFQYDEWGPSHWVRPDGLEVTQVGLIYSLPYSICVLGFLVMLLGSIGYRLMQGRPRFKSRS